MLRKTVPLIVVLLLTAAAFAQKAAAPVRAKRSDESVVRVLRTPNKAQINKYVCEALEFRNVNPFDIVNFFWAVTSREEGGLYSFCAPDGKSGYLVVICPEYQLPTLRKLAAELDRPQLTSAPGSKYIYYHMRHRNVLDPGFRQSLNSYLSVTGALVPDLETNSLLIYDAPAGADAVEATLKETMDLPLQQVEIGVGVYEIDVNNDATVGLDYEAWKNGPGKLLAQYQAFGERFKAKGSRTYRINRTNKGIYLDYPSAYFDFLVEKGKAKSVIKTKISAVNQVPALLTTGEQLFYYETEETANGRELRGKATDMEVAGHAFPTDGRVMTARNARPPFRAVDPDYPLVQAPQSGREITSVIRPVDTGITLAVVPTIGEVLVNMDLNLKLVNNTGFDGAGRPLLASRQFTDSVAVHLGDEVIFGGLVRERKEQTTRKIPILGSLPIIGYLFGGELEGNRRTVVVAVISPRPVVGSNNVTDDDRHVIKQVNGEEVVVLPESQFCFEQAAPFIY